MSSRSSPSAVHAGRRSAPLPRKCAAAPGPRGLRGLSGRVSLAILALVASACGGPEVVTDPPVILITLDTLRADHLGCYGYERATSPALDAFASRATRYTRAKATAPWTLPSHASLFTGQYPVEHGAHTYWIDPEDASLVDNVRPLSPAAVTLAERFGTAGYQTAAFAANIVFLKKQYGLDQGFGTYDVQAGYAPKVNARALEWLDARDTERPFFLFLNYMDTHSPYNTAPRAGWAGAAEDSGPLITRMRDAILPGDRKPPAKPLERLRNQYDLGIRNLDDGLAGLFTALHERSLFDPALIIIASDHGEYFGEHRLIAHSKDVYEPVIAIPLIVKAPGQTIGETEERLVSLAHVPVLIQPHCPVLEDAEFSANWPAPTVLSENHFTRLKDLKMPWAKRFLRSRVAMYEGDTKLIHSSDGAHELYELSADPPEHRDRAAALPAELAELVSRLEASLERLRQEAPEMDLRELSEEEIEALRALGYF